MEQMIVKEAFTEDDGNGGEIRRKKGDAISVTNERAEILRERGLVRKKPEPRAKTEKADEPVASPSGEVEKNAGAAS